MCQARGAQSAGLRGAPWFLEKGSLGVEVAQRGVPGARGAYLTHGPLGARLSQAAQSQTTGNAALSVGLGPTRPRTEAPPSPLGSPSLQVEQMFALTPLDVAGDIDYKSLCYIITHGDEKEE